MDWHWQGQGIICTLSWFNHKTCQIFLFNFHHFRRCWRRVPSVAKRPAGKPEQLQGASGQHAHRWHSQHLHTHCRHFPIINSQRQVHAFNVWPTADLPELFNGSQETENCLGAALQAAYKMVKFIKIIIIVIIVDVQVNPTGGRITVVQGSLPNIGPGAVENREAGAGEKVWLSFLSSLVFSTPIPTALSSSSCLSIQSQTEMVKLLNPSTDFYKRLALECSGQQIAVDLFVIARWVKTEDNCWQN